MDRHPEYQFQHYRWSIQGRMRQQQPACWLQSNRVLQPQQKTLIPKPNGSKLSKHNLNPREKWFPSENYKQKR